MNTAPLIDSHCHLNSIDLSEFGHNIDQVIQNARANGVLHFLSVCVEPNDLPALHALADAYSDISISVGVHPNIEMVEELDAAALVVLAGHKACIAIGETGLDYYRTETELSRQVQRQRFREHIHAAIATSKPLIIHTREAAEDTLRVMQEEHAGNIGGVMHCFSEDWAVAQRALDLNFYISFSGIVTFKNAMALREVAKKIPIDRVLIETDSPYLAPVPYRGKQNQPAYVKQVAVTLSDLLGIEYEQLAAQTTQNFYRCFRL